MQWTAALAAWPSVREPWAQTAAVARKGPGAWPTDPVTLVVPFPAGGTTALLAKQLVKPFQQHTQQSLRLQYQSGAAGVQGAAYAASAPPDGKHLLMGGSNLAVARALAADDDFDLVQDLRPLALVARVPLVLLVNPGRMRSRTAMEWLSDLGRKPMYYRMASAGQGSSSHVYAEILRQQEALRFKFVHFRGAGPALQDLLAGSVDMMIDGVVSCLPHVRSGRLKALMVSGNERVASLPDVPCATELGVHAMDRVAWYGLFAPKQLPDSRAAAIVDVLRQLGADPQLKSSLADLGIGWGGLYGEDFESMVKEQTLEWAQRMKALGLQNILQKNPEEG
ncbi:Bug family tripartite tricarboxylate transporter substrate binding protein [Comamonas aquatica]|uniref:Bug family tripartite tricarboxylate transporter substrate binding protein n=1 Tax=Comamonas aquatica TaxID=225991 RepID=UPI0021B10D94|nr:tripartite tricarboxylate transporter substrate binding protein [Comamonas aquatica]